MTTRSDPSCPFARARGKLLEAQRETVGVLEARRDSMPAGNAKDRLCRALDSLARGVADGLRTEETAPAPAGA